jgi:hypothetical protein
MGDKSAEVDKKDSLFDAARNWTISSMILLLNTSQSIQ